MNNSTKASKGTLRRNDPEYWSKYFELYSFPIHKEVRHQLDFTNDIWLPDTYFGSEQQSYISPPHNRSLNFHTSGSQEFSISENQFQ